MDVVAQAATSRVIPAQAALYSADFSLVFIQSREALFLSSQSSPKPVLV